MFAASAARSVELGKIESSGNRHHGRKPAADPVKIFTRVRFRRIIVDDQDFDAAFFQSRAN